MGEQPSMVVRITGNIDGLKKSLKDGSVEIEGMTVKARELAKPTDTLHTSFQKFDSTLAALGVNIGTDVRALGELSSASGQSVESLGKMAAAGLAAGAAFVGWKIGRWISDLGDFDTKIGDVTAKLFGMGDAASEIAANNMAVFARASKLAGVEITDLHLATEILSGAAEHNAEVVNSSANRIKGWGMEIAKVKDDGNWAKLNKDIASQNFELKELSERYHISTDAIHFFQNEQKKADDAITESNARKMAALKESAAAQKEAQAQADRMAEAQTHLKLSQGQYLDVLAKFDQRLITTVKHYMDLGLSVQDISTLMGESSSKIGIVTEAIAAQDDALKSAEAEWQALVEAQRKACDEMTANAQKTAAAQQAAFQSAVDAIIASQQRMSAGNEMTYDLSTPEGMAQFKKLNPSAYIAPNIPPSYFQTHTLQDAIRDGLIDLYAGFKTKHFATGVRNFEGGMAIVGERGPELLNLPRGVDVIPNHELASMGGGVVINGGITVHGFVGTQAQLGEVISASIMAKQRSIGERFPTTARR